MAINSNPMLTPGQDIPPEVLQQLMAMRPQDWQPGNTRGQWYDPKAGQFGPTLTYEPTMRTEGVGNGSSEVWAGTGNNYISQGENDSTWGGNNVAHVWDDKGKYLGTSSAAADMRQLARLAAVGAAGSYAGNLYQAAQAAQAAAPTATALGGDALSVSLPSAAEVSSGLTVPGSLTPAGTTAASTAASTVVPAATQGMTTAQMVQAGVGAVTGAAALAQNERAADLADKQVDLATSAQNANQALLDEFKPMIRTAIQQQIDAGKLAIDRSNVMWDQYLTTWQPLEQQLATKVAGFDTPTRRESAAEQAGGAVASQFDQMRTSTQREMERIGLDPTTIAALGASSKIEEAKAIAGAQNEARADVEKTGLSLLSSAVNTGRGVPTIANATAGNGSSMTSQGTQTVGGLVNTQGGIANRAISQITSAANTLNSANANRNALLGDIFGAGLKLYGMWGG